MGRFRKNNIILFGLDECSLDTLTNSTFLVLNDLLVLELPSHALNNIYRLGSVSQGKSRPILIEFISYIKKQLVMKNAFKLKNSRYTISHDLSPSAKAIHTNLLTHMREARSQSLNPKLVGDKLLINGQLFTLNQLDNQAFVSKTVTTSVP